MLFETIAISISALVLFLVYFARLKSKTGRTFLFPESFLNKADEILFDVIKFVYKLHSLLLHNISTFFARIPHKVVHGIHHTSHIVAHKSTVWVEKITHKTHK